MRSLIPGTGNGADAPRQAGMRGVVQAGEPRLPRGDSRADRRLRSPGSGGGPYAKYLAIVREQWLVVLIAIVTVTGGVALGTAFKTSVYRATGTIEIRKQASEVVPVEAVFQFERISDQYLQTQYAVLRSPTLVRRTLSDTVLLARLEASQTEQGVSEPMSRRVDAMVERVQRGLSVDPLAGSRIVRVSFEASDPTIAAAVVNAVIAEYIASREESGAAALQRFAEQADSVRTQVLAAEFQLQRFVRDNSLGVVVGATGELENVPQERLRRLQQELTAAETDAYRAEALYRASAQHTAAVDSDLLKALRVRIAELQGEYSRLRSAFTDNYPRARQLRSELAQLDSLVAAEQQRVSSAMNSQHRATQRRRELLQHAVNDQRILIDRLATKQAEYERLKRDLDGQKQLYAVLQQKRKESAVAAALAAVDVAVLEPATPPQTPIRPVPKRDVPLGGIGGLMLGLGLAFVRAQNDPAVKTLDEVEVLSDVPVLALIPSVRVVREDTSASSRTKLAAGGKRYSVDLLGEAFRGLRTSLLFESTGRAAQTLLITSAAPGDGKTFVATNLAMSLAALGRRVLLVDADLRRPAVHRAFPLTAHVGLAEYLSGAATLNDTLTRNVVAGLDVLGCRSGVRNSADLLSSAAVGTLLNAARSTYEFVLVDAPALFINVPDARILSRLVDGVVLVVRSGTTPRDVAHRLLGQTPNMLGVVLNGYDVRYLPASYADYGEITATN